LKYIELWIFAFLTTLPDIDLKIDQGSHRNFLTHSIIIPILWLLWIDSEMVLWFKMCFLLTISIHLLLDLSLFKKKGGFFTVRILRWRLNSTKSNIYLGLQAILGIIIFLFWIILG
jgi:hypothetical protein